MYFRIYFSIFVLIALLANWFFVLSLLIFVYFFVFLLLYFFFFLLPFLVNKRCIYLT